MNNLETVVKAYGMSICDKKQLEKVIAYIEYQGFASHEDLIQVSEFCPPIYHAVRKELGAGFREMAESMQITTEVFKRCIDLVADDARQVKAGGNDI